MNNSIRNSPRRIENILGLTLFVLVFAVIAVFSRLGVDFHHDGLIFKSAKDVLGGLIPYKESFSQYNILAVFLHAGALAIWSPTLLVLKILTAFFYALSSIVLYSLWRRFLSPGHAFLSGLLWLLLGPFYIWTLLPWSSVMALFFQLLGLFLFIRHIESRRLVWLAGSGFVVALASWCRQPVGVLEMLALSFYLVLTVFDQPALAGFRKGIRRVCVFLLGFAACCSIFILWFLVTDSLYDWYLQNFKLAVDFAASIPQSWYGYGGFKGRLVFLLKTMLPLKTDYLLWTILPLNAVAMALSFLIKRFYYRIRLEQRDCVLLAVSLVAISSWHQYYPVPCYRHYFWAASLMIGLLVFTILEISRTLGRTVQGDRRHERREHPTPETHSPFWMYSVSLVSHAVRQLRTIPVKQAVLTTILLILIFGYGIATRAYSGYHRLLSHSERIADPSSLSGLYVEATAADTILQLNDAFRFVQEAYPGKNVVTTGSDAFYSFFSDRGENIHPLYVNWDITAAIYPEYPQRLYQYIRANRPIIVSAGEVYYHLGYRAHRHFSNGASLVVPTGSIPNLEQAILPRFERAAASLHIGLENDQDDELRRKELDGIRLPPVSVGEAFSMEMMIVAGNQVTRTATLIGNSAPKSRNGFIVQCEDGDKNLYALMIGDGKEMHPLLRFRIVPHQPCHLVITKSGGRWTAYINGTRTAQSESPIPYLDSPRSLFVGSWYSRNYRFTGKVREVRFFDTALSDREVSRLYMRIAKDDG